MGGINANGARISTLNDGRFRVRAVYYSVRHLSTSFACRTSWTAHTRSPTSTTPSVIGKRRAYRLQTDGQTLVCDMSEHETAWPELACVSDGGAADPTCGRRQRAAPNTDTAQASAGRTQGLWTTSPQCKTAPPATPSAKWLRRTGAGPHDALQGSAVRGHHQDDEGPQGTSVLPQDITRAVDV
jgi:hypothetical protein